MDTVRPVYVGERYRRRVPQDASYGRDAAFETINKGQRDDGIIGAA